MSEEWTPGFGRPYFREPKYFQSPTVAELRNKAPNLKEGKVNKANPDSQFNTRYYTDDEILSIWEKPLEDYEVSKDEQEQINKNPYIIQQLLLTGKHAPCRCHILNMKLDKCDELSVGTTNKSMIQDSACVHHFYRHMKCLMTHSKWYDARREALRLALPTTYRDVTGAMRQAIRHDVADPESYYREFNKDEENA